MTGAEATQIAEHVTEVLPGMWRLQTALPGHRLGWLNSYLLTSPNGAVLIDTPWGRDDVREEFFAAIEATGTDLSDIRTVLLTHYHDDHSGCAAHLQRAGAVVALHPADVETMCARFADPAFGRRLTGWLARVGADAELVDYAVDQQERFSARFELPAVDIDLADGQLISSGPWQLLVVHTPGHTPGSVSFFESTTRTMFVGDHVFPRRRSNAVHRPLGAERPLAEYWAGMQRLVACEPVRVMPGHEHPFEHLDARLAELAAVRDRKSHELLALVAEASDAVTAFELAPRVRRRASWGELDGNSRLAACGEALAYLIELEHDGRLESVDTAPQRWRLRKESDTS